jgi:hypothetical protein
MKKISFCINTAKNEINHIRLLFQSLEKNLSTTEHEIIVFVDSDNQNTTEWLISQKGIFPNLKILKNKLPIPYGYQLNINHMFYLAKNDIVSYIQSDMVICKNYDLEILKHIEPNTIICSTRIEPPLHPSSGEKITYDFGLNPLNFNLEEFTKYAETQKTNKKTEFFFAPFSMYKDVWNSIGGHNSIFRRSREDTDILTRLVLNDIKIVQIWNAIVYHFTCTSSRGPDWFNKNNEESQHRLNLQNLADQIELGRFFRNWGYMEHSTKKRKYYEISAKIKGNINNLEKFYYIERFFNKVYVDNISIVDDLQKVYDDEHIVANNLLGVTTDVWDNYKYMFNKLKASERIFSSNECNDEIVVEFNFNDFKDYHFNDFLINLQHIIGQTDVGEFEYDYFNIFIKSKNDLSNMKIKITNPTIKEEDLYLIL